MTGKPATIVLLNGAGSSGKSSIARAFQSIAAEPFLHVQMDVFCEMLPSALQDHPDGIFFETRHEPGEPVVSVATGAVGRRLLSGMRRAVAAMAGEGNNLIVDDVLLSEELADYRRLLEPFRLVTVGIFASLEALEERERKRGDRLPGLARWQFDRVHRNRTYDLELDTTLVEPDEAARIIRARFGL